jgi:hypothetical protein
MLAGAVLVLVFPFSLTGQNAVNSAAQEDVTFTKDVAPILYGNCVYCHRAGEVGPMQLLTYNQVRPWARAIRQAVVLHRMPPWQADPHWGEFRNNRRLSDRDVQTIVSWIDGGSKEGNPADLPPAPEFVDGWQIGVPHLVVTMREAFKVQAKGDMPWVTLDSEYVFPEDTWIEAIEVRPGSRQVVHHATVGVIAPGESAGGMSQGNMHLYSPGLDAMIWREGYGKFVRKGSRLVFGLHYQANGKEQMDLTKVGFKFAKKPVHTVVNTTVLSNGNLLIPPMVRTHEGLTVFQFAKESRIHGLRPHMHLRGKNGTASLISPDGTRKVLLHIPQWDDGWQNYYVLAEPITVPKGALLEFVANYDNSPANPFNPNPQVPVEFGQQIWQEMHVIYITWSEVNDQNVNDTKPIQIAPNEAFTTGALSRR